MTDNELDGVGRLGFWHRSGVDPRLAAEAEQLGYGAIWLGGSPAGDLAEPEALLDATSTITVGTSIVNIWRESADQVAQSYHRIAAKHPGRFVLGIGIGHPENDQRFTKPYDALVAYLGALAEHGVPSDRTMLAALGPKTLELAARSTAGSLPYLTTPEHTRQAREIVGARSLLIPEQKLLLDTDEVHAREVGRAALGRYLELRNYVGNLRRLGFTDEDFADGGSDRLVDVLAVHGDAATLAAAVTAHLDAGADQVAVQLLGGDPLPGLRALAEELKL